VLVLWSICHLERVSFTQPPTTPPLLLPSSASLLQYAHAWKGRVWSDPVVYPEYLNVLGSLLYLLSGSFYPSEVPPLYLDPYTRMVRRSSSSSSGGGGGSSRSTWKQQEEEE